MKHTKWITKKGGLMKDYKTLCFDIDGVLTNETEGHDYENRTPNEFNNTMVRALYSHRSEYKIVLFTSRYEIDRDVTISWLKKHNIQYDEIYFEKPQYDFFIDDKAINEKDLWNYFTEKF